MFKQLRSPRGPVKDNTADPRVRLISPSPRPPLTTVERSAVAALNHSDTISFSSLVERVARDLYREELGMGGWTVDLGLFGPKLFVAEVALDLRAGNGILWEIASSGR